MPKPFYVTTPIYYVNDVPHLGTAYTTIAADVLTRYHRARGEETFFLTGTDEHGLKMDRVARGRGLLPKDFSDEMNLAFRQVWPELDCICDHFVRTTDADHEQKLQTIWRRVRDNGDLYLGSYEGWYCVGCEAYYTEKELDTGSICPVHRTPAERVKEPSYFFRLSAYTDRLLSLYERNPSFVAPVGRLNEVKGFVRGGLEDLSVSRATFKWGVGVPDDPEHVMYVWFDALFSYLTPMQTPERKRFWPANLHLIGKDILRFHAVYWPAFLLAAGFTEAELPKQIFAHGWLAFNGQKMSKSLRNTVKPVALAQAFGVDSLRYYLMRAIAFGQDGDFNLKDLVGRYNAELGNAFGNLVNRVLSPCVRMTGGTMPAKGDVEELDRGLERDFETGARAAAEAFEAVQPHRALEAIWGVIAAANQYVDRAAPWAALQRGDTTRAGTIFATAIGVIEAISVMAWPVLPRSCNAVRDQLGLPPLSPQQGVDLWPTAMPSRAAGQRLGNPAPLFPRIDAAKEAALVAGLGIGGITGEPDALSSTGSKPSSKAKVSSTQKVSAVVPARAAIPVPPQDTPGSPTTPTSTSGLPTPAVPASPAAPASTSTASATPPEGQTAVSSIVYDDFAKVDLRVGVVRSAERVPRKDKLLLLKVDLGEAEPRTIVAGIALSFQPDQLVGRRVVVVANLEPRSFGKGLVSQGMLLAAGPSDGLELATVGEKVAPGTRLK